MDKYNKTFWKDHIAPEITEFKFNDHKDGTATIIPIEVPVEQQGTPVIAKYLNNAENGIEDNRNAIITLQDNITALNVQTQVMFGSVTNGMTDNIFIEDLENLDDVIVERGIYSDTDKKIYV